jgi:hypothetical protein
VMKAFIVAFGLATLLTPHAIAEAPILRTLPSDVPKQIEHVRQSCPYRKENAWDFRVTEGDEGLMKLTLVATVVAACILFGSSNAKACDPDICEGTVEATGNGIVVGECNFLEKSQLQKACAPGNRCRVESAMNNVLKVCPLGSRCHVEAEFGRTSETICAIKRL